MPPMTSTSFNNGTFGVTTRVHSLDEIIDKIIFHPGTSPVQAIFTMGSRPAPLLTDISPDYPSTLFMGCRTSSSFF
jgi:hypothetical protein